LHRAVRVALAHRHRRGVGGSRRWGIDHCGGQENPWFQRLNRKQIALLRQVSDLARWRGEAFEERAEHQKSKNGAVTLEHWFLSVNLQCEFLSLAVRVRVCKNAGRTWQPARISWLEDASMLVSAHFIVLDAGSWMLMCGCGNVLFRKYGGIKVCRNVTMQERRWSGMQGCKHESVLAC
jgi:hypothetical protein